MLQQQIFGSRSYPSLLLAPLLGVAVVLLLIWEISRRFGSPFPAQDGRSASTCPMNQLKQTPQVRPLRPRNN